MAGGEGGIGVVGGGPAGLAAAWRLASSGRPVCVYEAADRVGGALRTERVAEVAADTVVQLLARGYDRTLAMLRSLDLEDRLVRVPGRDALWRDGAAHPVRYGSFTSMIASRALPARLKLRLGMRYVPFLERQRGLSMHDPAAASALLDEESIAAWGGRELGREFVELMAYPILASYYGVTPEETSAAFFHALARSGMDVEVLGIRGGAGALAADVGRALEQRGVEIRTGSAVSRLTALDDGVRVGMEGGERDHAGVVVALPAGPTARLVPGADLALGVRVRSTATLVLATSRPSETGWFGLSIPRSEPPGETLASICVQEEKRTGLVPEGRGGLVVVPAPGVGERWATAGAEEVLEEALPAVERVLPGIGATVVEARRIPVPEGVWLPEPGHFRRLGSAPTAGESERIQLAGAYRVSPSVEGAVRSGIAAAERISASAA